MAGFPLVDTLHAHLGLIATPASPQIMLDDLVERASAGTRVLRSAVEMIRFPRKASKLVTIARLDRFPDVDVAALEAEGFVAKRLKGALRLSRDADAESLLFVQEDGYVGAEHARERDDIPAAQAAASLAEITDLAPFAPLALGKATLKSWGLARDEQHGLLGLVAIHRDLERGEEDEIALRAAGFRETGDEGIWSTRDGRTSLVWMGGTVYGYVGPVPEMVGGWL